MNKNFVPSHFPRIFFTLKEKDMYNTCIRGSLYVFVYSYYKIVTTLVRI